METEEEMKQKGYFDSPKIEKKRGFFSRKPKDDEFKLDLPQMPDYKEVLS